MNLFKEKIKQQFCVKKTNIIMASLLSYETLAKLNNQRSVFLSHAIFCSHKSTTAKIFLFHQGGNKKYSEPVFRSH